MKTKIVRGKRYYHGQSVTCSIQGKVIKDAKISINDDATFFICQNEKGGAVANDMLGYKYSWFVNSSVNWIKASSAEDYEIF